MQPKHSEHLVMSTATVMDGRIGGRGNVLARIFQQRNYSSHILHGDDRADASGTIREIYSIPQFVVDTGFIVALAVVTGIGFHEVTRAAQGPIVNFFYSGLAISLLFGICAFLVMKRRSQPRMSVFDRVVDAVEAWTFAFAVFVFVLFIFKLAAVVSRGALLTLYFSGIPAISVWRASTPRIVGSLVRKSGSHSRECIVIGDVADPLLNKFASELEALGHPEPEVITFNASCIGSLWAAELKRLASKVAVSARGIGPGELYICSGAIPQARLAMVARSLAIIPRAIFVVPDAVTGGLVRCRPLAVGQHVALEMRREPMGPAQRVLKRTLDILVAAAALALLAPLFLATATAIKFDSRGSVFFRQTRNGYQGKPFKIWKFRSMHVQEDGAVVNQAKRNDPRVTRVGRFLRKSSIDELPQLLNILVGDMSFVGPRPHAQAHDRLYAQSIENYEVRQHVKPGLTGWAQVNGLRGETASLEAMYKRIEYDLWYAANSSVLLDIEIMVRTAIEVFRQRNAY